MANDPQLEVLRSIDARLALLTISQERDMRSELESVVLRSKSRIKMFDGIDGVRTSRDLAAIADVSDRAAQLFIKELLELGLVSEKETAGRTVIVDHDRLGLVAWYLSRPHKTAE